MKKLFVCLCAGVLLAGCGGGGSKEKITKTCSMEQQGINLSMVIDAEGDAVTKAVMKASAKYEDVNLTKEDVDALTDEQKKAIEEQMIKSMGMEDNNSVEAKAEFTDTAIEATLTYNVGDLEKLVDKTTVDEIVKVMEEQGMTCK